jgi:hypothetical protein
MEVSRIHRAAVTHREAVMFTVTMGRSLSALSIAAAVAVATTSASAQVVITSDGGGIIRSSVGTVVRHAITTPDDSVRSYLTRFEPNVLDDDSGEANIVTLVLDSDGAYVRSSARHAKIIQATSARVFSVGSDTLRGVEPGEARVIAINGDSARTITFSNSGEGVGVAVAGGLVAVNALRSAGTASGPGMLAGVAADEIGGIAPKQYAAGEMGKGPVVVTVIYLK